MPEQGDSLSHDEIDGAISARLASVDFGRELAEEGITTIALDAGGHLIEHRPDGTATRLGGSSTGNAAGQASRDEGA